MKSEPLAKKNVLLNSSLRNICEIGHENPGKNKKNCKNEFIMMAEQ